MTEKIEKNINLSKKYISLGGMQKILRLFIDAIAGKDYDYTNIKLGKAILLLSIPMVMEMMMESAFAIVDMLFVSRLGADAVASVGLAESLMTIFYSLATGLSIAATTIIARRCGEKDLKSASSAAYQAILAGIAVSIVLAIPGIFYSKEILTLMGANANVVNNYHGFLQIVLGSNTIIILLFVMNAIFRGAGDAAISFRVLFIANILNIILDPIFIFGWGPIPALGVRGAAIATTIGRGTAVLFQLYILISGKNRIRVTLEHIMPDFKVIWQLFKLASGVVSQQLVATASWILMMRFVSEFGSIAIAGYTITLRIVFFALMPSLGMANATATLVGQNLGAKKPERAEKSIFFAAITNTFFLVFIGLATALFPEFWMSLFISDPNVIADGGYCLQIFSFGSAFYGLGLVFSNALNGAGDTVTPLKITFVVFWLIEIPLAYLMAFTFGLNAPGVYWAILIAESIYTITTGIIVKRGKWKTAKV